MVRGAGARAGASRLSSASHASTDRRQVLNAIKPKVWEGSPFPPKPWRCFRSLCRRVDSCPRLRYVPSYCTGSSGQVRWAAAGIGGCARMQATAGLNVGWPQRVVCCMKLPNHLLRGMGHSRSFCRSALFGLRPSNARLHAANCVVEGTAAYACPCATVDWTIHKQTSMQSPLPKAGRSATLQPDKADFPLCSTTKLQCFCDKMSDTGWPRRLVWLPRGAGWHAKSQHCLHRPNSI